MFTSEQRKQIVSNFLETICGISNIEYQKRVWILAEGPECDDFTETTCHFFDAARGILKNYKDFNISEEQINLLIKFRDEFEKFSDANDYPELFVNTLEWKKITEKAKEILKSFNYQCKPYEPPFKFFDG